jgi:hypothetical protein
MGCGRTRGIGLVIEAQPPANHTYSLRTDELPSYPDLHLRQNRFQHIPLGFLAILDFSSGSFVPYRIRGKILYLNSRLSVQKLIIAGLFFVYLSWEIL